MDTLERLSDRILILRGVRVILDADLAQLYGVQTRRLNEQVRRNLTRFPPEFLFRMTNQELMILMSQIATSKQGRGGTRKAPFVFTEHGAIMAAMVLNSPSAVEMSVFVVRAFVQLRKSTAGGRELDKRLDELECRVGTHDHAIRGILAAIRQLTVPPAQAKRRNIGFVQD